MWAERAVHHGEPNGWFDADREVSRLSAEELRRIPEMIAIAEAQLAGPTRADTDVIEDALNGIGMRVAPGTSDDAATGWVAGLMESFGQIPVDLLRKAVAGARYRQFQFLNEVGPWIAEQTAGPTRMRTIALNRLREMELKANALPAPSDARPTPDQVDAILAEHGLRSTGTTVKPEPHAYKGPPPGGWQLADGTAEKAAIVEQIGRLDKLGQSLGRKPMTREAKNDSFKVIRDARARNGQQPAA